MSRLVLTFVSNVLALMIASYLVAGFLVTSEPREFLFLSIVLTLINFFIRPFIKVLLSPFIILTLGLFAVVINATILYLVDIYSESITITGLMPLILATLIISIVNVLLKFFSRLSK
jgi:putative membrane protein